MVIILREFTAVSQYVQQASENFVRTVISDTNEAILIRHFNVGLVVGHTAM